MTTTRRTRIPGAGVIANAWIHELQGRKKAIIFSDAEQRAADILRELGVGADDPDFRRLVFRVGKIAFDLDECECVHCGWAFLTGQHARRRRSGQMYCSNRCRVAAQRAHKKQKDLVDT